MKRKLSIKTTTQLAIFLANTPGSLARACEALAKAKINIDALATEGGSFGPQGSEALVRMVVSEPEKAVAVLGEVGADAIQTEVLTIEGANQPGMVAAVADRLARAEINIESAYLSSSSNLEKCVLILRPSDVEQALRVLGDL